MLQILKGASENLKNGKLTLTLAPSNFQELFVMKIKLYLS